ncbi:aspartyl-phosphate phosphatase Spo0E family protein [Niallia sp. Man26]|uniref:aspartyl-phosphate phosphatase Spo0E family protein n=1 Tax=Niallia sp. Man26 TaxID=2912824 RepID=UPI0024A72F35|nr:aspartyl-phosphate phosphatase Spo0E family protein [Niallia sp. Man26]
MRDHLDAQINRLRNKMIYIGMRKGFSSKETLILSTKLDSLLILKMRLLKEKNTSPKE